MFGGLKKGNAACWFWGDSSREVSLKASPLEWVFKQDTKGGGTDLVGANPSYDFHMLRGFFKFANKLEEFDKYFEYLVIDVLDQGRLLKKEGKVENAKLVTVASYYKVPLENAHDAKYDCECTYELFKMFRKELKIKEEKS
jgi:DNA polymerase III alpha subunit (gram-positive type)